MTPTPHSQLNAGNPEKHKLKCTRGGCRFPKYWSQCFWGCAAHPARGKGAGVYELRQLRGGCRGRLLRGAVSPAKEKEINESLPEWYTTASDDRYFYVPGTAVSDNLQLAIDNATNAAFRDLGKRIDGRLSSKAKSIIQEAGLGEDTTSRTETNKVYTVVLKEVDVSGYQVVQRKMVTLSNGKYRIFVLLKYPLAKTYSSFVEKIENNSNLKGDALAKIKNTEAFKDLEKAVSEYTGS